MLRQIVFFSALILWMASIFDDSLGDMLYLVWIVAFLFSVYGYSLVFALLSLLMSVSYLFIDTSSETLFFATLLPWIFGVLATTFVIMASAYYLSSRKMEYIHDYSEVHNNNPRRNIPWFFF